MHHFYFNHFAQSPMCSPTILYPAGYQHPYGLNDYKIATCLAV